MKTREELIDLLRLALPYVKGAYECAFPDQNENDWVIEQIQNAIKEDEQSKNIES